MERETLGPGLLDRFRLVLQIPLQRGEPLRSAHPALLRHRPTVMAAVDTMWREGVTQRFIIDDRDTSLLMLAVPTTAEMALLLGWDLGGVNQLVFDHQETVRDLYRDLFYAASQSRLVLMRREEVPEYLPPSAERVVTHLERPEDIGLCRTAVMERLFQLGYARRPVLEFGLAASEAATNAIKHGGGGRFTLLITPDSWYALVEDRGPGIDLSQLPYSTLLAGFTTSPSLGIGYGFTTMLRSLDRVGLYNGPPGVTLLLQKNAPDSEGGGAR